MTLMTSARGFNPDSFSQLLQLSDEPEWMKERRKKAWELYNTIPMPTRSDEEWRRTDLRKLDLSAPVPFLQTKVTPAPSAKTSKTLAAALTIADGAVTQQWLSDTYASQGVVVTDMKTALSQYPDLIERYFMTQAVTADDSKFAALHGAFWNNGVFIHIPKNISVTEPISVHIAMENAEAALMAHSLALLDNGSAANVVVEITGTTLEQQSFSSRINELVLGANAQLNFTTIQNLGAAAYDFYTTRGVLQNDAQLTINTIELGARLSKGRIEAILRGNGSHAQLYGLYLGAENQHYDRFTLQDHLGLSTSSNLLFKGILSDTARSVYSGFIRVHPGAKKSQAYQQNRNILLNNTARADSIPNLEISESDILGCSHGATVGKVDPEELFYLMCRGLTRIEATQLLMEGFAEELIAAIPLESAQAVVRGAVIERVAQTTAKFAEAPAAV